VGGGGAEGGRARDGDDWGGPEGRKRTISKLRLMPIAQCTSTPCLSTPSPGRRSFSSMTRHSSPNTSSRFSSSVSCFDTYRCVMPFSVYCCSVSAERSLLMIVRTKVMFLEARRWVLEAA